MCYVPRGLTWHDSLSVVAEGHFACIHGGVVQQPGCCGSVDVVHVKWCHCPAGDFNRAKGKETFPSLGFQCITDFNRRILSVYGPHFGSRNDMDIVKMDIHVHALSKNRLHREARWWYYGHDGHVRSNCGSYLISDDDLSFQAG